MPSQPLQPQTSGGGPIRVPPLSPDKVNEYMSLFDKAGARNGMLGGQAFRVLLASGEANPYAGDEAKQVFEKARLPNEVLGQIWNLSDREQRGALSSTEFVVAMHLLASMRNGSMRAIPNILPPGLYEAASRKGPAFTPSGHIPRQFSGQGPQRTQSPLSRPPYGSPALSAQSTGNDWLVTPQEKAKFDQAFASVDRSGQGYITGDQAVSFFRNSGLSEDTLATIWDLADIRSEGQLSREEFAVAMYLIRQQRAKKDGRNELPSSLLPQLIPPSMRQHSFSPAQSTAPTFDPAPPTTKQSKSAADDLFGLDAFSSDSPAQPSAQPRVDPFANEQATSTPSPSTRDIPPQPPPKTQGTSFKPFVPTSSFGQGLSTGPTPGSQASNPGIEQLSTGGDDLLGDNDPEESKKLTEETTELANMSNQIGNLRNQMEQTQTKKTATEREVGASSNQKKELEARLNQFRSQYERQVQEVKALEQRLNASRQETRKMQSDLAMIEGTHQDLKNQHQQLMTAYQSDQQENASLKEKTRQLNSEISQLRPQVEQLKSDARQQKGMTAINKKQLSTSELERDKLFSEKSEAEKSINDQATAAAMPKDEPAQQVTSRATSTSSASSKNPFFRQTLQPSVDRSMSPSAFSSQEAPPVSGPSAFDSVFGPSQPSSQKAAPPPTTSGSGTQQDMNREIADTSSLSTPSTSPQPAAVPRQTPNPSEPPAPPESRQITSSALPFRPDMLRSESPSSSVKANAPASRSGFSDKATPTQSTASSVSGDQATPRDFETPSRNVSLANSAYGDAPTHPTGSEILPEPAFPIREQAALAPKNEGLSRSTTIPGAFPGEVDSSVQAMSTGGSTESKPRAPETAASSAAPTVETPRGQPPFDSAFASAGPAAESGSSEKLTNGAPRPQTEFPPIRDIEPEESESESEQGFDDSFDGQSGAQSSRVATREFDQRVDQQNSPISSHHPNLGVPHDGQSTATSSGLPNPNEQKSPPTYDQTVPESRQQEQDLKHFPREYGDLLPSREVSHASPEPSQSPHAFRSKSYGNALDANATTSVQNQHISGELRDVAHTKPTSHDDFDSAFDDLDEAKEDDEQGQEQLPFGQGHREEYEFNPTFDSPAHSKSTTLESQPSTSNTIQPSNSFGASESSASIPKFDFNSPQRSETAASSHDWDAIFSGLDKTPSLGQSGSGASPFTFDQSAPSQSQSLEPPERPQHPARAISNGTEHDDPILKTLTGMGYQRDDALKALEKFDYNLDKVCADGQGSDD